MRMLTLSATVMALTFCGVRAQEVVPPQPAAVAPTPAEAVVATSPVPTSVQPTKAKATKQAAEPAARVWTSYNGHTITAEFVEIKDGSVALRDENGATRNVRLGLLLPVDQAKAQELDAKRLAGPVADAAGASPNLLPVFREGGAKGLHAIYSNANFVATVAANGALTITCLDGGAPVGRPITFAAAYGYADKAKHSQYVGRRIVSYQKTPKPTLAPTVLSYEATLVDDVKVGLNYEFKKNTVQVWGWIDDPAGISYPTSYHLRFAFRASHDFADDLPVVERKKVVAPYALTVSPVEGKPVSYPYGDKAKRLEAPAQRVEIEGPLFGKRRVSVDALASKDAWLGPWIYPDFAPYQGYSVGLHKEDKASRNDRERMILTVD